MIEAIQLLFLSLNLSFVRFGFLFPVFAESICLAKGLWCNEGGFEHSNDLR